MLIALSINLHCNSSVFAQESNDTTVADEQELNTDLNTEEVNNVEIINGVEILSDDVFAKDDQTQDNF